VYLLIEKINVREYRRVNQRGTDNIAYTYRRQT